MKKSVFYTTLQGKIRYKGESCHCTVLEDTPCLGLILKGELQALIVLTVDDGGMITHIQLLNTDVYSIYIVEEKKKNTIYMLKGHDDGSCFWIHPCNVSEGKSDDYEDFIDMKKDELSIEEDDVWYYLTYFCIKYFDDSLAANQNRVNYYDDGRSVKVANGFEWNLEHNLYTYGQMDKLLEDIFNLIKLMRDDNQEEIKRRYPPKKYEHYNLLDLHKNIYDNCCYNPAAAHILYVKFIEIIREMMQNNPDCKYFSVMGP